MSDYTPYDAYTMRECIERQDATIARLEAEKAQKQLVIDDCKRNLQEQDAAIAALRGEVERLRAENAQLKCNFAPILHFARQEQEKRGEPSVVIDSEGIPIENAVLRRNYITLRSQLERAEKELAAERGKSKCNHEWKEWTSTEGRPCPARRRSTSRPGRWPSS
jgi:uncharacterized small protein (DUF1192 family)